MNTIWTQVQSAIKNHIPGHKYRMWIDPIQVVAAMDGKIVLSCPNAFSRKRVVEYYGHMIQTLLYKIGGKPCELVIEVGSVEDFSRRKPEPRCQLLLPTESVRPSFGRMFRKNFTFDQFVVGGNNDFAYSASLSLASGNGGPRAPLFLLSNTGMGKSHLSQAVGRHILDRSPEERVYYMTAEDFSSEMVSAYRNNEIDQFKKKYRNNCDVLLLEDVHHLSGKERTQIELAASLDMLSESNKKVIFSSCCLPGEIPRLNDKLRSCLSSGLISAIEPPNFRTRVRILRQKAAGMGCLPSEDVIHFLASELSDDVRQLESGLIGVAAKSSLLGAPIDLALAGDVVKNIARQAKSITIDSIKKLVCKEYKITVTDIVSKSRKQAIVRPRQMAMFLSRRYTDSPLQAIGKSFNRRHATAIHSIGVVERGMKENSQVRKQVEILSDKLTDGKF